MGTAQPSLIATVVDAATGVALPGAPSVELLAAAGDEREVLFATEAQGVWLFVEPTSRALGVLRRSRAAVRLVHVLRPARAVA